MTPDEIALAKRLVECEQWRWDELDGVLAVWPDGEADRVGDSLIEIHMFESCYPDLHDWATVGCLLGMAVEATKSRGGGWYIGISDDYEEGREDRSNSAECRIYWDDPKCETCGCTIGDNANGFGRHPGPAIARLLLEVWG